MALPIAYRGSQAIYPMLAAGARRVYGSLARRAAGGITRAARRAAPYAGAGAVGAGGSYAMSQPAGKRRKVQPKRKPTIRKTGGYTQTMFHRSIKTGRPMKFKSLQNRHTKFDVQRHIQYFQGSNPILGSRGFYGCNVEVSGTGTLYQNLRFFELSTLTYNSVTSPIAYFARKDNISNAVTFNPDDGQDSNGTPGASFPNIVQTTLQPDDTWNGKLCLKAVGIKMALYGSIQRATKFKIQIVSFTDPEYLPSSNPSDTRSAFYDRIIKQQSSNPVIQLQDRNTAGKMKVIKTQVIEIQPTTNTESDVNPHQHVVSYYHNFNKDLNYNRKGGDVLSSIGVQDASYTSETGNNDSRIASKPRPRERIFLMVSCYNDDTGATFNNARDPSFDLSIKQYFVK